MITRASAGLALCLMVVLVGCDSGPRDVQFGLDRCAHCMMIIDDDRFAAQLVTSRGKTVVFDSIECMALHDHESEGAAWVWSKKSESWIDAAKATFYKDESIRSPMGGNFILSENTNQELEKLSWREVIESARQ